MQYDFLFFSVGFSVSQLRAVILLLCLTLWFMSCVFCRRLCSCVHLFL